jgi:hypothetical protein
LPTMTRNASLPDDRFDMVVSLGGMTENVREKRSFSLPCGCMIVMFSSR